MGIKKLQESVKLVKDPRRQWRNIRHKLGDILIIGLCSVICQGEDYEDMELFGTERKEWLEGFWELPNGIPDSDTFWRVYERIDPQELSKWLNNWLETERKEGSRLVSVDGKTIRGSGNNEHSAYHVVSAWVGEQGITLREIQVGEKTNEITQVPELLDLLDIRGDIVTTDAMNSQKEIAAKIKEKQADYVLALKGNQPTMENEVKAYFDDLEQNREEKSKTASWTSPVEKEHGRIEKRTVTVAPCDWFQDRNQWKGLTSFIRVKRTAIVGEDTVTFDHFYISRACLKKEEAELNQQNSDRGLVNKGEERSIRLIIPCGNPAKPFEFFGAGRIILCKRKSTKSRMALRKQSRERAESLLPVSVNFHHVFTRPSRGRKTVSGSLEKSQDFPRFLKKAEGQE